MKKILAIAAVAALTAGVSAYAANPFADVTPNDWAYQAVSSLSDQGIVEGYPDGTFKGQQNMTRYELAQITARLLAKEDQYNAEQKATIDKLAAEYADELNSLGVRVENLEKKVGNVRFTGDARMRYQDINVKGGDDEDKYDGRIRLNMSAQVNDTVTVEGRFLSSMNFTDGENATTSMDRLHAIWAPSDEFKLDLGRTSLWLGQTGVLYDDTFDGVKATYDNGKFGLEAGYGRLKEMYGANNVGQPTSYDNGATAGKELLWSDPSDTEAYYVQAKGQAGPVNLTAFYLDFVQDFSNEGGHNRNPGYLSGDKNASLWGVGAAFNVGQKFVVDGDYIVNTGKTELNPAGAPANQYTYDQPKLWNAGITYGAVDTEKPGTFAITARYVDAERGSYFGSSTLDLTNQLEDSWTANGAKFWVAKAAVAAAKNVEFDAYYNFNAEDQDGKDLNDSYGVELNYFF